MKDTPLQVYMEAKDFKKIKKLAYKTEVSMSQLVRDILKGYVDQSKGKSKW